jgi:hypothetical protein
MAPQLGSMAIHVAASPDASAICPPHERKQI